MHLNGLVTLPLLNQQRAMLDIIQRIHGTLRQENLSELEEEAPTNPHQLIKTLNNNNNLSSNINLQPGINKNENENENENEKENKQSSSTTFSSTQNNNNSSSTTQNEDKGKITVVIIPEKITFERVREQADQLTQTLNEAVVLAKGKELVRAVQRIYEQTLTLFNLVIQSGWEMAVEASYLKETLTELVLNAKRWLKSNDTDAYVHRDAFRTSCTYLTQAVDVVLVSSSLYQ